jgi:3-oxoacyl-[acyl-carrier-protein] synthase II
VPKRRAPWTPSSTTVLLRLHRRWLTPGLPTGDALGDELATRIACVIGSGIGGLPMIESMHTEFVQRGARRISPFFVPSTIVNMIAGHVSIRFGFKGPNLAIVTACTTGLHCIGQGGRMIEYGDADVVVAGGVEATVSALGVGGFAAMRALSTRNDDPATASRPWDKDRDGFVLGEGAGVVVLEEYEHAKARGARIYAELAGFGMSADAGHMTAPNMDGPRRAMEIAMRNAGVNADQIDYVNAHGTSTPLGDLNESNAIKAALGEHAKQDRRQLDQVDDRAPAGRRGRPRIGGHRAGAVSPEEPADHQYLQPGPRV